ncbi:MAG: ankyrin repeat domain-containing protein [Cellvibrionaceae bacterium]|nr:ankyrin repeat domain-containing protein [Cellvibrionaceae bacterium]
MKPVGSYSTTAAGAGRPPQRIGAAEAKTESAEASPPPRTQGAAPMDAVPNQAALQAVQPHPDEQQLTVNFIDGDQRNYCLGELKRAGELFDSLEPTEGDEVPLPVTQRGFEALLSFLREPERRLMLVADALSAAHMLGNDEARQAIVRQLMQRAFAGEPVGSLAEAIPDHVNIAYNQPSLADQVYFLQRPRRWEDTNARLLGSALARNALHAARCLCEVSGDRIFGNVDWVRFDNLFSNALQAETADSLNLLKTSLGHYLPQATVEGHVNRYCQRDDHIDSTQLNCLLNSEFAPLLSADSTAAIQRSWLSLRGDDYLSALIQAEAGMVGIQTPEQASDAFANLFWRYKNEHALMDTGLKRRTINVLHHSVSKGANVNEQSLALNNCSPLEVAVLRGQFSLADLLIDELGADINHAFGQRENTTILIEAAKARNKQAFPYLLARGADKCQRDSHGRSAYNYFAGDNFLSRRGSKWNAILAPNTPLHIGLNAAGKLVVLTGGLPLAVAGTMLNRDAGPLTGLFSRVFRRS